jgi:hypothetical protein
MQAHSSIQHPNWESIVFFFNCPLLIYKHNNGNVQHLPCWEATWVNRATFTNFGKYQLSISSNLHPYRHETALFRIISIVQHLSCCKSPYQATCIDLQKSALVYQASYTCTQAGASSKGYHQHHRTSLRLGARLSLQATCIDPQEPALLYHATYTYSGRTQLLCIKEPIPIQTGNSSITSSSLYLFRQETALSHRATCAYSGRKQLYHIEQRLAIQAENSSILN